MRKITKAVKAGGVAIGGGAPVSIQSMTNTRTDDVAATVEQINRLASAGCHIVRVAVPDKAAARAIFDIKKQISPPLVADIHFDYRLALLAIDAGADKIRINPGNIGGDDRVKAVADACRARNIPIRIGVNSGSIEREILARHGGPAPEAMVESALYHRALLNRFDFDDICVSLKSSSVPDTVRANLLFSEQCDCPLHLGVTEAGTAEMGILKSAAGIGGLLCMGVGDTVRVSLTAPPEREVEAADKLLRAVGLYKRGANIVSCPTCGRCRVDLIGLAREVERRLAGLKTPLTVAVMGCAVNGPGEAREADVGIACGENSGLLFIKGEIIEKLPWDGLIDRLTREVERMTGETL